jgi:hypothetical protein
VEGWVNDPVRQCRIYKHHARAGSAAVEAKAKSGVGGRPDEQGAPRAPREWFQKIRLRLLHEKAKTKDKWEPKGYRELLD